MQYRFGNAADRNRRLPPPRLLPGLIQPGNLPQPRPSTPDATVYPKEVFAPIQLDPAVQQHLKPVKYEGASPMQGRVNTIEGWESWDMGRRLAFLRAFTKDTARDPAVAAKAAHIIRASGKASRDHQAQWAALLKWVQTNILYVNEPNERIQSPQYTLTERLADCDDMAILLAALGESIRLPWRFVISGRSTKGERVRFVEGSGAVPTNVQWSHIYLVCGWPPFQPAKWMFAEPTLDVPLGWDTIAGRAPKGRADLAGRPRELAGSNLAMTAPETLAAQREAEKALKDAEEESFLMKAKKNIPWWNIAAVVTASVVSALIVKGVVEPRFAKKVAIKNPRKKKRKHGRSCRTCGR